MKKLVLLLCVAAGLLACNFPVTYQLVSPTSTGCFIAWNVVSGEVAYNIDYQQCGDSNWTYTVASWNPYVQLNNLKPNTYYRYRVSVLCDLNYPVADASTYTAPDTFKTTN